MRTIEKFLELSFTEGENVWVRRHGPSYGDKQYKAIVRGIYATVPFEHYIVEWVDKIETTSPWSCGVIPKGCLDKRGDDE